MAESLYVVAAGVQEASAGHFICSIDSKGLHPSHSGIRKLSGYITPSSDGTPVL